MIGRFSIRWKLTFAYLLTVLLSISVLGFYLSRWTEHRYVSSLRTQLADESRFVGRSTAASILQNPKSIESLVKQMSKDLSCRVTIIRADGSVLGDSDHDPATMENHSGRPEIRRALETGLGWSIRRSSTLHARMMYVATPFGNGNHPIGIARLAESLSQIDGEIGKIHRVFFIAALMAFVVAAVTGARISSSIAGPIVAMNAIARRFSRGDLSHRIEVGSEAGDEIAELARTLNLMASELRQILRELDEEKAKLETIFIKTDDGLVVVDDHGAISIFNPAAARILGISSEDVQGKTVIQGTLNHDLSDMVERVLRTGTPASLDIRIDAPEPIDLNVYVTPLEKPDSPSGAVIVMHDITAARHAESVRRDFVANVSHELRTPLASMKAMAETIVLRGSKDFSVAADFAQKIITEADRLAAISDDLLDLAKIEAGRREIRKENFPLAEVAERVASQCLSAAQRKAVELSVDLPGDLLVLADREAVYQILVNLVDNAIKYTQPGGDIDVTASRLNDGWVAVKVSDTGIGIPQEDLSRIFERFYRVDKARSRESGGTGLGLSIVKHLVESHGGKISVESSSGQGSTFTFTIPTHSV